MPLYYFVLKNGRHVIPDRDGEEFTHEAAAREYAVAVARELMRNAPLRVRSWRLQVSDENLQPRFELLFAAIDDSLSHLPLHLRNSIEHACQNTALLYDTIVDVQDAAPGQGNAYGGEPDCGPRVFQRRTVLTYSRST